MNYEDVISLLGKRVKDKMTGIKGTITSICFDLYGCIQVTINSGVVVNGVAVEPHGWIDINRLIILKDKPIMEHPDFFNKYSSLKEVQGPAEKPLK